MTHPRPWLAACLLGLACDPSTASPEPMLVGPDPSDAPIAELDAAWRERFTAGDAAFEANYRVSQGLGPVYIRTSCASCHKDDAKGPGFVNKMAPAQPDAMLPWGDTVRPYTAAGATTPIEAEQGAIVSTRVGPAVFARGYLEAVADTEIERVEAEQAAAGGIIRGHIHRVPWRSQANPDARFHGYGPGDEGLIGRFGLKASIPTLDEFSAAALLGDMSITSPLRPEELPNPDGITDDMRAGVDVELDVVNLAADYVRLLGIPARLDPDSDDGLARGQALFDEVGCGDCHVPALHTRADWPIAAVADIDAPIYTDLLLHDMGDALADGLQDGDAGPRDWRTAPLIGLRHLRSYLHDGRAATIDEAVRAHGDPQSEAREVTAAYEALSDDERDDLLAFVGSL
ncbi:MAG: di-heme oxidoredictase family protein [Nannocystaceae bacterium]